MATLKKTFSYRFKYDFHSKIVTLCLFTVSVLIGYKVSQYNTYYGVAVMVMVYVALSVLWILVGKVKPKSA